MSTREAQPVEGGYRCVECGHGEKLWAWEGCNAYGPLAADGQGLDGHEDVIAWGIYEGSIECREHPGAMLESVVGGQWCRWWSCPKCKGGGYVTYSGQYGQEYKTECRAETPFPARPARIGDPGTTHEGWLPAGEHEAAMAAAS